MRTERSSVPPPLSMELRCRMRMVRIAHRLTEVIQNHFSKQLVNDVSALGKEAFSNRDSALKGFTIDHPELADSESLVAEQFIHQRLELSPVVRQTANASPKFSLWFRRQRGNKFPHLRRPLNFNVHPGP